MTRGEARLIAVQVVWKKRPRSSPDLVERVAIALQEAYEKGKGERNDGTSRSRSSVGDCPSE